MNGEKSRLGGQTGIDELAEISKGDPGAVAAIVAATAHFSEIVGAHPYAESGESANLNCKVDRSLIEWYRNACGRYRVTLGDFLVGAFEEAQYLSDPIRIRGFVDERPSEGHDKLDIALPTSVNDWITESASEAGVPVHQFVDACLRSRKAYCDERQKKTGAAAMPPELKQRLQAVQPALECIESGQFAALSQAVREQRLLRR